MKENSDIQNFMHPQKLSSYFRAEIPVLSVVTAAGILYNVGMLAGPWFEGQLVQCLYDILQSRKTFSSMLYLALFYVLTILFVQLMRSVKRFGVRRFANNTSRRMRRLLYHSLIQKEKEELEKESTGSLMTKAIADVDTCTEGMRKFTTELFDTGVVLIAYLVMLFFYDARLTVLAVLFTPAAYFAAYFLKKKVWSKNSALKESSAALNNAFLDRVSHSMTYRIFGQEGNRNASCEEKLFDYEKKAVSAGILENSLQPLYGIISMTGVIFIIVLGAKNMTGTGFSSWDLAAFTTYLSCFSKLAVKSSHAAKLFNSVQKAQISWKRISPLMREPEETGDGTDSARKILSVPASDFSASVPVSLSVSGLTASFPGKQPFLNDLSFDAKSGEIIGITGSVACGKTAFSRIFLGEIPYEGSIRINGRELRDISASERSLLIAYQGHDSELLSDSIEENILLGKKGNARPYLADVCMEREADEMPEQILTNVGSGGTRLSGGQKKRTALARALCQGEALMVLDDPFSAVDKPVEKEIFSNLRKEGKQRIILLFSHRLSLFPDMDRVILMKDGKASSGSHTFLMETDPDYRALFLLQSSENFHGGKEEKTDEE